MILGSESEREKDERKSVVKRIHGGFEVMLLVFISRSAVMANYFFANYIWVGVIITCSFLSCCV